jgi:hypothetical protein
LPSRCSLARIRGLMGEEDTIWSVWRGALSIIAKYPLATLAPAAVLGAIGEIPAYLIESRSRLDFVLTIVTAYVAYYLYLAYAEGIVYEAERGMDSVGWRGVKEELLRAVPFVLRVLVAALITLFVTSVSIGLLVIPGAWLYTRWSLATPVIRREGLGVLGAMGRSNQLVRGNFWFVFLTATVAYYLEEVVIHAGAEVALLATGSSTWGEWVGGSMVATLVIPLGAFATSLAYSSLARLA